ncbi:enolase, partial [Rhizobium leguminosarum]
MFDPDRRTIPSQPPKSGFAAGPSKLDAIRSVTLSLVFLPLARPISDAKVLTG